jgi:hypothetical protein
LFAGGDLFPDRLRTSLYGLCGYLQIGQQFHVLASVIEGGLLADDGLHAAHAGGELRIFDIQFNIRGRLPAVTVWAQIIGTRDFHPTHRSQDRLGA